MKRIVVTGCSRGLGLAMARGFVQRGHQVFGCARQAVEEDGVHTRICDVTDDAAVKDFAEWVIDRGGAPDLLINNAASINRNAPLWEIEAEEFARLFEVNVFGVTNVIRHFVPPMVKAKTGIVVNFSSYWGRSTSSEVAPYCASKWAIEGLTSALSLELPDGLAAVAVNPGIICTDMLLSTFGESARSYLTPDEWAKSAVPFLEGLDSANNGNSLTVPGQ